MKNATTITWGSIRRICRNHSQNRNHTTWQHIWQTPNNHKPTPQPEIENSIIQLQHLAFDLAHKLFAFGFELFNTFLAFTVCLFSVTMLAFSFELIFGIEWQYGQPELSLPSRKMHCIEHNIWHNRRYSYFDCIVPPESSVAIWKQSASEFPTMWNFPHYIGALDGTHVVVQCLAFHLSPKHIA